MRSFGILLHISSLEGEYGLGTLGRGADRFIEFLKRSGAKWWQTLPVGPVGCAYSPYQSCSAFAGNPLFIDPELLYNGGLIGAGTLERQKLPNADAVDFSEVCRRRDAMLKEAAENIRNNTPAGFYEFIEKNDYWLDSYSLFMAKSDGSGAPFWEWERELALYEPAAVEREKTRLEEGVFFHKAVQYLFFNQWADFKRRANENGIKLFGDMPIYVGENSADVWASPELFRLDENRRPSESAGCPPDAYSEDGQLWGNPLYNWECMRADGYGWWIKRLSHTLSMFDSVRIDHFRGFASYYSVPAAAETAKEGRWNKGPGIELFEAAERALGKLPLVAEDLGYITDSVRELLHRTGYPGMKVLQFAFGGDENNPYLPKNHIKNSVAYVGTHDNDTLLGWYDGLGDYERAFAERVLNSEGREETAKAMIAAAMESEADRAILTVQDILSLGAEARMNTPSTVEGNWLWRLLPTQLTDEKAAELRSLAERHGRAAGQP